MKKKSSMKKAREVVEESQPSMPMSKDKSCVCASCPTSCGSWSLLLLRIVVGIAFIFHGWPKIMAMPGLLGLPGWIGSAIGVIEVLAGIAMIVGIFTKWAGYLLAIIMAVALVFIHIKMGWGSSELPLLLLVSSLTVAWCGPGVWSLHSTCKCCEQ